MTKEIPQKIIEDLLTARDNDKNEFLSLILALKNAGWTFADLAEPLNVTRSAANQWHKKALALQLPPAELPEGTAPVTHFDPKGTVRKIKTDVPPKERERLREVATLAQKNTRWARDDSPERLAAEEFEKLIRKHVLERKVPITTFSNRAGVTRRAVMQRVEKFSGK